MVGEGLLERVVRRVEVNDRSALLAILGLKTKDGTKRRAEGGTKAEMGRKGCAEMGREPRPDERDRMR